MGNRTKLSSIAGFALVVLSLAACDDLVNLGKSQEDLVRERVDFILSAIQKTGGTTSDQLQIAICRWYNDKIHLSDMGEMEWALDHFEEWQQEAGIYPRLQSYEIVEIRPEEEGSDTMLVLTKINGGYRWMVVPPKASIAWAKGE